MKRSPALSQVVPVFCLFLAGAVGVASAAGPAAPAHRGHRSRALSNYGDPTRDDSSAYDDPVVRQVAVDALGHTNGSVLAMDPTTGRILAVVNQKMAFSSGFEPCSTIKPVIALAGLQEGAITHDTMIRIDRRRYMDLTEAMAHSNNNFFEQVGSQLGFDTVIKYAHTSWPGRSRRLQHSRRAARSACRRSRPPTAASRACRASAGGIRITPLQLASLVSTLANGGTQFYLQYPRTPEEQQAFQPRIRRELDIAPLLPDLREGMLAAVLYGTARQSYDPYGEQALGKTGTCNDESLGGRLGWYVSYADQAHPKIVLVVLIRGGNRHVSGPHASEIAGRIYHGLRERNYFAEAAARNAQYASSAGASH